MGNEISAAKLAANRRNARKSTGPRTWKGKKKSRFNALKHGLTAKTLLLPGLEDPTEFKRVLRGLLNDLNPNGAVEKILVQRLAADFQKIQRGLRVERNAFVPAPKGARKVRQGDPVTSKQKKRMRGPLKIDGWGPIELMLRYQADPVRAFDRTLKTLHETQRLRKKDERKQRKKSAKRQAAEAASPPEEAPGP